MRCFIVGLLAVLFVPVSMCRGAESTGPYEGGKFKGRIAYSCDGNHNDPDDWAASPIAIAIIATCAKDKLVHFDYNCILPKTDPEWEKKHADGVLGAAERYGFDKSLFHDCQKDVKGAVDSIAKAIDASSAASPLYFILAGPMEVPIRGIKQSNPEKRKFVYCISHSEWNDGFAAKYAFTNTKRGVIELGVHWVQIAHQSGLQTSPYGRPGKPEEFQPFHWMRDARDAKVRFLWERMQISTRPDATDAGMAYFLVTGDEQVNPVKLRSLLAENEVPKPVDIRKQVRLEAENFLKFEGYELEFRNDRTASHRVGVKPTGNAGGRILTRFDEPYTATSGRYDIEVRYFDEGEQRGSYTVLVNDKACGDSWESAGKKMGWTTQTIRDVEVRSGDEIAIKVGGTPGRLDYVQLNYCEPAKDR